jgi:hypothetical protein
VNLTKLIDEVIGTAGQLAGRRNALFFAPRRPLCRAKKSLDFYPGTPMERRLVGVLQNLKF